MIKTATVILAAGKGKRMKSDLPKVLHKAAGMTLVEHVANASFRKKNHLNICVVSGENRKSIEKVLPGQISLCIQKDQKGTADAVKASINMLVKNKVEDVLVLPGDMPLIEKKSIDKLFKMHKKKDCLVTLLTGRLENPSGYGRIIRDDKGDIIRITEDRDLSASQRPIDEINTGVYVFNVKFLASCLKKIRSANSQKEFYLTDSIEIACQHQGKGLKAATLDLGYTDECLGVNSRSDLARVSKKIFRNKAEQLMISGVTIEDPDTVFIDSQVKVGKDTLIRPFSVISGNVVVGKNCEIGPFAHIREGVIMKEGACVGNFVEVKKSVIGEKTKAKHLSYLGNAVLGSKVNIGAGTITANYDGFNKHETKIKDNTRIGSNTVIVAPSEIGKNVVTGAGSVVTGKSRIKDGAVVYGVPARERKGT